jgi:nucleoside-triphosphatase
MPPPRHVILTGPPGVGKTTAIKKVNELLVQAGVRARGFFTEEVREEGKRIGFDVVSIENIENRRKLARLGTQNPTVGQYSVALRDFEYVALPILGSVAAGDIIIIDEIGRFVNGHR